MGRHFGTEVKGVKCIENPTFANRLPEVDPEWRSGWKKQLEEKKQVE